MMMSLRLAEIVMAICAVLMTLWELKLRKVRQQRLLTSKKNKNVSFKKLKRGSNASATTSSSGASTTAAMRRSESTDSNSEMLVTASARAFASVGDSTGQTTSSEQRLDQRAEDGSPRGVDDAEANLLTTLTEAGGEECDESLLRDILRHYEKFGHVVTLKLNRTRYPHVTIEALKTHSALVARLLSTPSHPIHTVVADDDGIAGELRQPVHSVIWRRSSDHQEQEQRATDEKTSPTTEPQHIHSTVVNPNEKAVRKVLKAGCIPLPSDVTLEQPVTFDPAACTTTAAAATASPGSRTPSPTPAQHNSPPSSQREDSPGSGVGGGSNKKKGKKGRKQRRGQRHNEDDDSEFDTSLTDTPRGGVSPIAAGAGAGAIPPVPPPADLPPSAAAVCEEEQTATTPGDKAQDDVTERWLCGPYSPTEVEDLSNRSLQSPTFTTHIEGKTKYSFDVMRVMFCSGNTTERMHFGTNVTATGETVLDMFAGIGYFTLPLARNSGLRHLYALEKNPDSCAYLRFNAAQNNVRDRITVICGDNRVVGSGLVGQCDRVSMGYIPDCAEFIPRAVSFLRRRRSNGTPVGVIHYHFLAEKPKAAARSHAFRDFVKYLGEDAVQLFDIVEIRTVKSFSPKRYHHVADVEFGGSSRLKKL